MTPTYRDQAGTGGIGAVRRHDGFDHERVLAQHGLDLGRLDEVATDLDGVVLASSQLQLSPGVHAGQIAAPVALSAAGPGVEAAGLLRIRIDVARRQRVGRDEHLAGRADLRLGTVLGQDVYHFARRGQAGGEGPRRQVGTDVDDVEGDRADL